MRLKFHFYYPDERLVKHHFDYIYIDGIDHWVLSTFLFLKESMPDHTFTIGLNVPEEGIIFFHKRLFPKDIIPKRSQFFVCFQVDYGRYKYAHWHIVHNPYQTNFLRFPKVMFDAIFPFSKTRYINPWPQKEILPRDPARLHKIKNISFHGSINNLSEEIKSGSFNSFLSDLGYNLIFKTNPKEWKDYRQSDLTLAIRDFSSNKYYSKPFLKLSNSLLANVPVIAGDESSSKYFCKHYINVPIIKNVDDLKKILIAMRNGNYNPFIQIDKFMIIRSLFTESEVLNIWLRYAKEIINDFEIWKASSNNKRKSFIYYRSQISTL